MRTSRFYMRLSLSVAVLVLMSVFFTTLDSSVSADSGSTTKAAGASISGDLVKANGKVTVAIQLTEQPLAQVPGQAQASLIKASQDRLMASLNKYGVTELARLSAALNAVVVEVDAANVSAIAKEYGVKAISKVSDYAKNDTDTAALIGATAAQQQGFDGTGRVVAVLDSGVDYTHKNLGGPGTQASYDECEGLAGVTTYAALSPLCKSYFGPSAPKVIDGYDFVGQVWPNGPLAPDANPISSQPDGGHGTHVADIIAGVNPAYRSVAPGAKVVAVKVCSNVSSSCSGVAILQGLDYVTQKKINGFNIDVINMSLGASYGQQQSAEITAVENATHVGILAVISAGNSGDKPYIAGSASTAPGALSVAQTAVPSDSLFPIVLNTPTASYNIRYSIFQPFSTPLTSRLTGPVQYGNGAGGNLNGCAAYPAGTFTGKIAFIDRGTCAISIKVSNADAAGAIAVIIGLVAPGDPSVFSYGGGTVTTPAFVVNQVDGNKFRTAPAGSTATIDPANIVSLAETIIGSSSRGPSISDQTIKPEIGAPGGSVSAIFGTATGVEPFSGTSGAAPMVAGSALLVKQKYPSWSPLQVKSRLMNTAYTGVQTLDSQANFYPTPITRIGSGEVRANKAINSNLLVSVNDSEGAALSFGYTTVANTVKVFTKTIHISNLTNQGRLYTITGSFRDPADEANGAVTFQSGFPRNEWVDANSSRDVVIQLQVNGQKLRPWNLNASTGGGTGSTINELEYDGYIKVDGGAADQVATLPWQVFPHKAADTRVNTTYQTYLNNAPAKVIQFANDLGVTDGGRVETFQLLGSNGSLGPQSPVGSDQVIVDLKSFGVRDVNGNLQFAISAFGQNPSPNYPAEYDVYVDVNGDNIADFVLFNTECGQAFGNDGRNCLYSVATSTGRQTLIGFTDSSYNSGNIIYTVPLTALGLTSGQKIGSYVSACDNYFTGACTDQLPGGPGQPTTFGTYTIGQPRFSLQELPWQPFPAGQDGNSFVVSVNGFQVGTKVSGTNATSSATGFLFMYRDANDPNRESETVPMP